MKKSVFIFSAATILFILFYLNFTVKKTHMPPFVPGKTNEPPAAIRPYSQSVETGHTIFISGQVATDPLTGKNGHL